MAEYDFDQPILPQSFDNNSFATPDIFAAYENFKKQQQSFMQQQAQVTEDIQNKQAQAQARGVDLDVAGRMYKVFDPNLNPKVRQFLLNETAQYVGADTKGQRYKDVSTMIMGLDPDTMTAMKELFANKLKDASPGQIKDTINGILTGQISMSSFVDEVGQMQMQRQQELQQQRQAPIVRPFQPGQPSQVQSFEGQRTVPPNAQQVSPQLVGALGLDSTQTYRNSDLIKHGYRIPFDAKDQEKLATDISTQSVGVSSLLNESAKLIQIFEGRPEVLGTVGSASQVVQGTIRQVQGALRMIGAEDISNPYSDEIQNTLKGVTDDLQKRGILQGTAEDASRIQAMVLSLAYRMAQAENIPGNRLTNGIIQQHLMQIGHSASPEQFKAVLSDTLASTIRQFDENIRRTLGADGVDIVARSLTDADIALLGSGGVGPDGKLTGPVSALPKPMARAILDEAVRRKEGAANPNTITPASPTIEEEQNTLGQLETQGKQRKMAKDDEEMRLAREREERAGRQEQLANQREERTTRVAEGHLGLATEQALLAQEREERQAKFQEENAKFAREKEERATRVAEGHLELAKKNYDLSVARERRQAEQHQQDKIGAAFAAFGKAIANMYSGASVGGGGRSLGADQNEAAFRINPAPQRVPPRPPGK